MKAIPSTDCRKGILLAGGAGTRLYPLTQAVSKQLLAVYDKPMVYYSLSVLLLAGIRRVLVISTPQDVAAYERLLGDGRRIGAEIQYAVQQRPAGLAQAFLIGREFVGRDSVALALGDNIFYGQGLEQLLEQCSRRASGATIFACQVRDPTRYGIVEIDAQGKPLSIEEKPARPKSSYAVPGLYFYDNQVLDIAQGLSPSPRGELEITDVNRAYLEQGRLWVERLGRGVAWLDAGTCQSLLQASMFVEAIQQRQGIQVACIEEIAYRKGWICPCDLERLARAAPGDYGQYLRDLARGEKTCQGLGGSHEDQTRQTGRRAGCRAAGV